MAGSIPGRVVVAVDGSPHSVRAVQWAAEYAVSQHRPIEVVTVWDAPIDLDPSIAGTYEHDFDWQTAGQRLAEGVLTDALGADRPRDLKITSLPGNAAAVLVDYSRDAALLVVGSRGRGTFKSALLGSVSVRCVEHASCPVAVIRPTG